MTFSGATDVILSGGGIQDFSQGMAPSDGLVLECC